MRPLACVLLLVCAPALADDTDKKVVQQAAPDETVSLAKQDMESFRRQGNLSDPTRLTLMQAPELSTVPVVGPSPTSPEQALKDQTKKNSNWLVDGVMGSKKGANDPHALLDPKDPRSKESDRAEILKEAMAEPGKDGSKQEESQDRLNADDPKAARVEEQAAEAKLSEAPASNPLNAYMAAWMTPKDLEILKPVDTKGTSQGSSTSSPETGPDIQALVDAHADHPAPAADKPEDNPFIDLLNAPQASEVQEQILKAPAAPAPAPEALPAPTLVPDQKGVIPDFAKPLTDDPAFKGMKRF